MLTSDETVIVAGRAGRTYLRDLWRYRELFVFLAWRDLLVRYRQTVVGVTWAVVRPLLTMLALTLVFGRLGRMPSGGVPYPLLVFCGLLPWQFFTAVLTESGNSLVSNASLISKVYFPRLIVPATSLLTSLVDFLISLVLLVAMMIWFQWLPPATIVWLPAFLLLAMMMAFGAGAWAAALTVQYRDFRVIVPFAVQFGLYISPVGFVSSVVPEAYRSLYALNPMVGIIDGFRWCLLGGAQQLHGPSILASVTAAVVLLVTGTWYFRRTERSFADVI